LIQFKVKTVEKDGTADLHELGFPEMGEAIDYVIRGNGEVLKAGHYPEQSLFFVPALPVPSASVKVGDTWPMDHTWYSAKDGIPLRLQVIGILKDIVACEGGKVCADIEISGDVKLGAMKAVPRNVFSSRLWGRMLFSLDRGDVIWSQMRSREDMKTPGHEMKVSSCMLSEMQLNGSFQASKDCDPAEEKIVSTPRL
jgi:hypothetical protein